MWNQAHSNRVSRVVFSSDGSRLASASEDSTIDICDVNSRAILQTYRGHDECVDVCFVPNNDFVATCVWDNSIRFWDAVSQAEPDWCSNYWYLNRVEFSPDGRLYALSNDTSIFLYDPTTDRKLWTAYSVMRSGQTPAILTSPWGFDAQGRWIAAGHVHEGSGHVRICDIQTGKLLPTLRPHNQLVTSLQCLPDGRMATGSAVIAGGDQTVKIWDATLEMELLTIRCSKGLRRSLSFSPDGWRLAVGGGLGGETILDARPLTAELRLELLAVKYVKSLFAEHLLKKTVIRTIKEAPAISDALRKKVAGIGRATRRQAAALSGVIAISAEALAGKKAPLVCTLTSLAPCQGSNIGDSCLTSDGIGTCQEIVRRSGNCGCVVKNKGPRPR